ncbi:MAG TPA: hypothetical protein ENJ00_03350 [Phycisphaerales bacterium]|nr:hypothetical protein [Phycisphaerales bacterium]
MAGMAEVYELAPELPRPELPGDVIVRRSPGEVADAVAADLFLQAQNCVRAFGDFHLALSGGQSPLPVYHALMLDPAYRALPWKRTHLWVVHEPGRGPSACELIEELIVTHGDVPREQFHPMEAKESDFDGAVAGYERQMREHLGWREPGHDRFDFVLLGLGEDGSTAGYGIESLSHDGDSALVRPSESTGGLTLTLRSINAARLIAVVATGEAKRAGIKLAMKRGQFMDTPIGRINPVGGRLRWYLDEAACPLE